MAGAVTFSFVNIKNRPVYVPTGLHRRPIFRGEKGLLGNGLLGRFERVTFDDLAGKLTLSGSL